MTQQRNDIEASLDEVTRQRNEIEMRHLDESRDSATKSSRCCELLIVERDGLRAEHPEFARGELHGLTSANDMAEQRLCGPAS